MSPHDSLPEDKTSDVSRAAYHDDQPRHVRHSKASAEVEHIDAIALSRPSDAFKHLDEKKILRKMDMRLIPVLALLYLLSFLDRKSLQLTRALDAVSF